METTFLGPLLQPTSQLQVGNSSFSNSGQVCWNQPRFQSVLLCGPSKCGKTSLLFELAFCFAQQDLPVLFIAPNAIQELPCYVGERTHPREGALKTIELIYPTGRSELLSVMSSIHTRTELKKIALVIIDDMHVYFNSRDKSEIAAQIAKVCAYTVDAVNFLDGKRSQDQQSGCALVASLSITDEVTFFQKKHLLERWFPSIIRAYEAQNVHGEVNEEKQYKLVNTNSILSNTEKGSLDQLLTSFDNTHLLYKISNGRINFRK